MSFSSLDNMLDVIVELLRAELQDNAEVMRQFPPRKKTHPLGTITVAIGIKGRRLRNECIGNRIASGLIGRQIGADVEVGVYVPLSMNSKLAYGVFDSVTKALTADTRFGISGYEQGVLSANRATDSFELHGTLTSTLYETEE